MKHIDEADMEFYAVARRRKCVLKDEEMEIWIRAKLEQGWTDEKIKKLLYCSQREINKVRENYNLKKNGSGCDHNE